jgi:hypothetical protein
MEIRIHTGNQMGLNLIWLTSNFRRKCTSRRVHDCTLSSREQAPHDCQKTLLMIRMQELALYLDYRLDESYTPKLISVRAGNSFTDMVEVHTEELEEPHGWTRIALETQNSLQGVALARISSSGLCVHWEGLLHCGSPVLRACLHLAPANDPSGNSKPLNTLERSVQTTNGTGDALLRLLSRKHSHTDGCVVRIQIQTRL